MAEYTKLVTATKQAGGDANSEAKRDRVDGLANFEVLDPQVHRRGLKAVIGAADLDACFGQVNFAQEVGKLNARQAELEGLL